MKYHTFRAKRYKIEELPASKLKDCGGECDAPNKKHKSIRLRKRLSSPKVELENWLHETLHACLWDLDEEAIEETAEDISRFLWKLGYRRNLKDVE